MALTAKNRLSLKEYRGKFFETGKSLNTPLLQVIILKETTSFPLFAVSISKKVAKKAHNRNKLRRQFLQLIQENLSAFPPYKYLFLPKKPALGISSSDLRESFSTLLVKIKE